ncbi:MAG: hypothetical protein WAT09_19875 [Paracoccaceae bacterium]
MRVLPLLAMVASVGFLSACNEEKPCTQEEAQKKATELTTKITELAQTNPEKVAAFMPKMQEIATKMAAAPEDVTAACKALDEMAAELDK